MIATAETVIERIAVARGGGDSLSELALRAARAASCPDLGGVIAATFSNPDRFPSLAVRAAAGLGLPASTPAFDLQMACSAYPYAVYLAGKLAADTGRRILVIDGDVQSPLVDANDHATGAIFSDAVTATVVSVNAQGRSGFDFLSRHDTALSCTAEGPIRMDGFKVFSFVATEVSAFLKGFLAAARTDGEPLLFAPHQAQPYMVRQLARSLALERELLTIPDAEKNPGSCSVAMALALNADRVRGSRALIAGFGAGLSASAGIVKLSETFTGVEA